MKHIARPQGAGSQPSGSSVTSRSKLVGHGKQRAGACVGGGVPSAGACAEGGPGGWRRSLWQCSTRRDCCLGRALLPAVRSGDVPAGTGAGAGQCPCVGTTQRAPGLHRLPCEDHGCWLDTGHVGGRVTSVKTSSFQGLLHLLLESLWLGPGLVPAHGPPYPQRAEPSVPLCPLAGAAASLCAPSPDPVFGRENLEGTSPPEHRGRELSEQDWGLWGCRPPGTCSSP